MSKDPSSELVNNEQSEVGNQSNQTYPVNSASCKAVVCTAWKGEVVLTI